MPKSVKQGAGKAKAAPQIQKGVKATPAKSPGKGPAAATAKAAATKPAKAAPAEAPKARAARPKAEKHRENIEDVVTEAVAEAASAGGKPARRASAETMAARQREISVSEFFTKNRHLLGFDNPAKALLTTIKEAVDNS